MKLARLRRPKIECSSSYADYRPKKCRNIIWHGSHTKGRTCKGGIGKRRGNLKLECGWCPHCTGAIKVILNWQRALWEGDQDIVKRTGRNEPMWVAIYKHMEVMLGISLYSYFYLKLAKTLSFSYYHLCFLFNKIRDQEGRTGSAWNG
jgi:hypothetical protein